MACVLAGTASSPSIGAKPADVLKTTKWIVNWDNFSCQLLRAGLDNPVALKIAHHVTAQKVSVTIGNRTWKAEPSKDVKELDVVLLPSGEKFRGPTASGPAREGAILQVDDIDESFLAKLAASRGIAIDWPGNRLIAMNFVNASGAVEQLKRCDDDLLSDWGIDVAAIAALKQRAVPISDVRGVFTVEDYPESALRTQAQGTVVARLDIDKDGIITDCVAMEPRPDRLLVSTTCSILKRRIKFRPAVGADGQPVATRVMAPPITWRIPGAGPLRQ